MEHRSPTPPRSESALSRPCFVCVPRTSPARLPDMLFSRPLIIVSTLAPSATRERIRDFATSRDLPNLDAFRRRLIVSWRLSQANEDFVFQPEYGDSLDIDGTRFIGLVEPASGGSRIRGRVVVAPMMKIVLSVFMLAVVFAALATLAQDQQPAAKVLAIAMTMLGSAALMLRYSLRSTSRIVDARLRQCLEATGSRAA